MPDLEPRDLLIAELRRLIRAAVKTDGHVERRRARQQEWDEHWVAGYEDPDLSLAERRLAQTRKDIADLAARLVIPPGEDPNLGPDEDEATDPDVELLQKVLALALKKGARLRKDPLIADDEVEAEHQRQTRKGAGRKPG